jgi:hypothetical protein
MLLLVLEPPPDVVASLRASAHRVGGHAARHCAWYRALGAVDDAGPGRLAAMILLGPSASQAGMEIERERARAALQALCAKIDAHPQLTAAHGAARDHLAGVLERTADESELLAAVEALGRLEAGTEDAVQALFRSEVHAARPVHDPERLREVRRRIGEWAAWRAGEQWRDFADRIDIVAVLDRRSYRVQLGTQFESRRVAYRYTAADLGRMPAAARRTVDDVWACRMPALPEFGADLKLERPREVHCAACGARGRVELQQSWGSMAYPFSTTFACHDKVGVQCQSRMGDAVAYVGVPEAPQFVSEFIAAHATIDPAPERMLAFEVDRVAPAWIEHVEASAGARLREMLANAEADVRDGERISRQRLRVTWTGVTEIEYRFEGRSYRMWIPERVDVNPIAVAHPLPSADGAPAPGAATPQDPRPVREPDAPSQGGADMAALQASRRRGRPGAAASGTPWLRSVGPWLAILAAVACTLAWIVVSRI